MKGMIHVHSINDGPRVVGTKQTLKALHEGEVSTLFIAKDAKPQIVEEALKLAKSQNIHIDYVDSMEQLGRDCNVKVKTATAALINNNNGGEN